MARVQGMTPEGIRKAIAEAIAFIEDLNVEDLNRLLAAFEDANGIFDLRLVEVQEEVKKAGDKVLEAEEQATLIIEELARHQQLQEAESARILHEVATAIQAANLASDRIPDLLQRMAAAEDGLTFANSEFSTLIIKQDEFLDAVTEQTSEVSRINNEFVAVNQTLSEAVDKVDQSTIKVNQIGGDLELARTTLDAKIKQNQEDIAAAQIVVDEHQNEIDTLTGNLSDLSSQHTTLASDFSTEVQNLKDADVSQVESISSLLENVDTKVGELRDITDTQSGDITAAKTAAFTANNQAAAAHQRLIETVYPDHLSLVPMVPGGVNIGTEEEPVYRQEPSWRQGAITTTVIDVPEMTDNVAATYSEYTVYETTTKNTVPVRTQDVGFSVWVNASDVNTHMVFTLADAANVECVEYTIINEGPLAGTHLGCVIDTRQTSALPVGWTKLEGVITLKAGVKALRTEHIYFNLPHNDSVVATQYLADLKMWPMIPAQSDVNEALTKAIDSHAALFEGQNTWNSVATAAIESQATLLAKQARWSDGVDKALAWQDQLNNTQSDINVTTKSVLENQAKWNSAQALVNDSQSEINQATQSVLLNQSKWNSAQEKVNNDQSELNKAVKLVQDNQLAWNDGVTKALEAHDELFVSTSTTFKSVKAVQDNQQKWNKVVSDLVTTNSNVSAANKTAIEGLSRVLGLTYSSTNIVPMVPGGVRTGGTDIAPVFTPMPAWLEACARVTTGLPTGVSASAYHTGSYAIVTMNHKNRVQVDPNVEYKYSAWVKASKLSDMNVGLRDQDNEWAVKSTKADPESLVDHAQEFDLFWVKNIPSDWKQISGTVTFHSKVREVFIDMVTFNHTSGTNTNAEQWLADIQIYPNIPSQADVNKALLDSDAAQTTLLAKQELWNDASSRSIATVENLWGKTAEDVGVLSTLTDELDDKIQKQSQDFGAYLEELMSFIPRITYAVDGGAVDPSDNGGFIRITRTMSGSQTSKVTVAAVGAWVGTMIIEGDHGKSDGTNKTFFNSTPIRLKIDVSTGDRHYYLNRSTSVDHIGAVKVTFFVKPGQVIPEYFSGGVAYPDKDSWRTLGSYKAPRDAAYTMNVNATFGATTHHDKYGVRLRVGNTTIASNVRTKVGPLLPGESGVRSLSTQRSQYNVKKDQMIYLEAYSTASTTMERHITKWFGQVSHIASGLL